VPMLLIVTFILCSMLIKHGYSSLSLFSHDELVYAISYVSTV